MGAGSSAWTGAGLGWLEACSPWERLRGLPPGVGHSAVGCCLLHDAQAKQAGRAGGVNKGALDVQAEVSMDLTRFHERPTDQMSLGGPTCACT